MFYEEEQIGGITVFRTSPTGEWKPKKMNYTEEMQQANIPPEVGMQFICNDSADFSRIKEFKEKEVRVIGVCDCRDRVVITFDHKSLGIGCGFFDPCWVKPIDTRTDTEKAVDFMESNYGYNSEYGEAFISDIKAGKIKGVKWVGND